jgi:hypothetical protein
MSPNCYRCDAELNRPIPDNANYVRATDTKEEETEIIYIGKVPTERAKVRIDALDELLPSRDRDEIAASVARGDAPEEIEVNNSFDGSPSTKIVEQEAGWTETADMSSHPFKIPEEFNRVEVPSPEVVKDDSNDVVRVETDTVTVEKQKTGLVCLNCAEDDDEVIW